MASLNISDFLQDASLWESHDPDYPQLLTTVGGAVATSRADTLRAVVNIAERSPVAVAFVLQGDEDFIHIGHSPSIYPADPLVERPWDGRCVVLVGDDLATAVPVVLEPDAFGRCNDTRCLASDQIVGVNGHGANPPVYRSGPHANTVGNTNMLRARYAMLLPPQDAHRFVGSRADCRYTYAGFWNTFVQPGITDADAAVQANWEPVREWFRIASTNNNNNHSVLAITPAVSATPGHVLALNRWVRSQRDRIMRLAGTGGPTLDNGTFNAGMAGLRNSIEQATETTLDFERQRREVSFTQKHGEALALKMHRLCGVDRDEHLPQIHRLLAKGAKGRDYAIITSQVQARVNASGLPLTLHSAPIATTKIVEEVFRNLEPTASGFEFAKGLTPFSMICVGHKEAAKAQERCRSVGLAEQGASLTIADAQSVITTDVLFPVTGHACSQKLYAWSIFVDVFHGINHPVAASIRTFVMDAGPQFYNIEAQYIDNKTVGIDLMARILFDAQQEYFSYGTQLANGGQPAVPNFRNLLDKILTMRVDSLSGLPQHWYDMYHPQVIKERTPGGRGSTNSVSSTGTGTSSRDQAGSTLVMNANVDMTLKNRFANSGHSSITAMTNGHEIDVPNHGGKPVCLTWALRGRCSTGCRRKANHVTYSQATNKKLHLLMDTCGVANPQE